MDRTALTELLLTMACSPGGADAHRAGSQTASDLTASDWDILAGMAAQHRLEPILHDRLSGDAAVPPKIRAAWRDSHRFWTLKAAAARADLDETFALLDAEGFAPLALKGAFLAWHAYPRPALRPLRDIDILVPERLAEDAFALLRARGWGLSGEAAPAGGKHLAPLVARCGTAIELHGRLWERDGTLDHVSPFADHDAVRARAITRDGIAYPCPDDMIAHLIIHAVYSHRLDCGPLLLWDIRWLAGAWSIDWDKLRARASQERWEPGLDLVIALARRTLGSEFSLRQPHGSVPPPVELVDAAADLLLQDLDTRRSAGLAATGLVRGLGAVAARVSRGATARIEERADRSAETLRAWTGTRLRRTIGELIDPAVRDQARDLSRLSKWLGA